MTNDDVPKVSVIISNYQGMKYLPKCLAHLMAQTYKNYEVIFVDAGSTDGSLEYVRNHYTQIKTIACGRIGIGEAINTGIRNSSGSILVFDLNTDEYVQQDWMEELVRFLNMYNFNIIAGTTRIIAGTQQIDEAGVNLNWFGKASKIGHKKNIGSFPISDQAVDFVGMPAFHRKILEKVGLVDEVYFIYAEDLDFCYRAKLIGIETRCAPNARSQHEIRGTLGQVDRRLEYYLRRANIRFHLMFSSPIRVVFGLLYLCGFLPLTSLLISISKAKKAELYKQKYLGRTEAMKWNVVNLKQTLKKRREIFNNKKNALQ